MMEKKLVYGVGVNDADYPVTSKVNGKRVSCPYYRKWASMIKRCNCKKFHATNKTYVGCVVCEEWTYSFMAFKTWMETQDHEGKELDKDFCGSGKLYSPETCIFVSPALNNFMNDHGAKQGSYPVGVSKSQGKFKSQITINGRRKTIGRFSTTSEAHVAWVAAKTKLANELIAIQQDPRIAHGIREYINRLHNN